jgi:uncharacterized protein (DUF934 family)
MPLIKGDRIIQDVWTMLADHEALPATGPLIVPLSRWRADRETLSAGNRPLGVRLGAGDHADDIASDLDRFALVAVEFPTISDGRGYSTGRLLRERYGFTGELRAVGAIIRDQFPFLSRCGFDVIEAKNIAEASAMSESLSRITVTYQPSTDGSSTVSTFRRPSLLPAG